MAATNQKLIVSYTTSQRGRRHGFTLVEMLVVIGIILLLIGILLPAINRAYVQSIRTRMTTDIQAIATALEAYRQDHGDIPRTSPDGSRVTPITTNGGLRDGYAGAQILCRAMIGPGEELIDGAQGNGFRTVRPITVGGVKTQQARIYGPYIQIERFKLLTSPNPPTVINPTTTPVGALNSALLGDRSGKPILYYPGIKQADVRATNGYIANVTWGNPNQPQAMFNLLDNRLLVTPAARLQLLLGDNNLNGMIDGAEQPEFVGDFLLWGAGPDEIFGPTKNVTDRISPANPCDDVTNYAR
jgi:prepilin-type N-terminal cleavage/methylation domain-containing protein